MRYLIYFLLFISSNTFAQDSLRFVPVRAWQLSRLIQDAVSLRTCDTLVNAQAKEIETTGKLLIAKDKQISLLQTISDTQGKEVAELRLTIDKATQAAGLREKRAKRKGFKFGLSVGIGLGIIALLL